MTGDMVVWPLAILLLPGQHLAGLHTCHLHFTDLLTASASVSCTWCGGTCVEKGHQVLLSASLRWQASRVLLSSSA